MTPDLVIARGTVVRPDAIEPADVLVADGRVLDSVEPGAGRGAEVIDASGKIVLPGGIDAHVHFLIGFMGQRSVYDFWSGIPRLSNVTGEPPRVCAAVCFCFSKQNSLFSASRRSTASERTARRRAEFRRCGAMTVTRSMARTAGSLPFYVGIIRPESTPR